MVSVLDVYSNSLNLADDAQSKYLITQRRILKRPYLLMSEDNDNYFYCLAKYVTTQAESNHHSGKYHCTADLLYDWFAFDLTSKAVVHST